jgi:hypothetical protein
MRAHGEPHFPDPTPGESPRKFAKPKGTKHGSQQFQTAANACQADLPSGAAAPKAKGITGNQKALVAFAACMRANGVPNFPDPTVANGEATFGNLQARGIDRKSPTVKAAIKQCRPLLSGG